MYDDFLVQCSAVVDPFAVPNEDEAERIKRQQWVENVEKEMNLHRSPFIAAETVWKETEAFAKHMNHPDKLYIHVALPVLRQCVPALNTTFRDVVSAAIHELIPVVFFTRSSIINDQQSIGAGDVYNNTLTRISYAECFWNLYKVYQNCEMKLSVFEKKKALENSVMGRLVRSLDRLFVKMCFLSWRTYCRTLREKTVFFQKLALRGMTCYTVPRFIVAWRRYAHTLMLKAKLARLSDYACRLELLYPQERSVKNLHERMNEELREKMRLLKAERLCEKQTKERWCALQDLYNETQKSLQEHWLEWRRCVKAMFGDSHPHDFSIEENFTPKRVDYDSNITDSASVFIKRARFHTGKIETKQIQQCLYAQNASHLYSKQKMRLIGNALKTSEKEDPDISDDSTLNSFSFASRDKHKELITLLSMTCNSVISPLHLCDIMLNNQNALAIVLNFIVCMYGGGHCSLFKPSLRLCADILKKKDPNVRSPLKNTDDETSVSEMPSNFNVVSMLSDVSQGMERLESCSAKSERYLMSIRSLTDASETRNIQDYIEALFQHLGNMGLPLDRTKIECVTVEFVKPADGPIVHALYPSTGISTSSELINYLTSLAEFTGWPLLRIAERLELEYPYDSKDELNSSFNERNITQCLQENSSRLSIMFELLKEDQSLKVLSKEKTKNMFMDALHMSSMHADSVWEDIDPKNKHVTKQELSELLYIAAHYLDPSPFSDPVVKLQNVLDSCNAYIEELSISS
ncbi:unnamed protein product [Phytomonas sp. Hart1]|nr:unnamed protein product [Phytomonas sp. Hart1]|eukprot:CCW70560.1 unnamed protein product [Phytomonas sp. isolate Hart1]